MSTKSLRQIIETRLANLCQTKHSLEKLNKNPQYFDAKIEILQSVLDEFDGFEEAVDRHTMNT